MPNVSLQNQSVEYKQTFTWHRV